MTESTNFIVVIIIRVIRFFPSFCAIAARNRCRRSRQRTHTIDRIERADFRHNIHRGRIVDRVLQITAQNRAMANQTQQALINAILKARQQIGDRHIVHSLRTRNERPARMAPVASAVHMVQNQDV